MIKASYRLDPLFPAACLDLVVGSSEGSISPLRGTGGQERKKTYRMDFLLALWYIIEHRDISKLGAFFQNYAFNRWSYWSFGRSDASLACVCGVPWTPLIATFDNNLESRAIYLLLGNQQFLLKTQNPENNPQTLINKGEALPVKIKLARCVFAVSENASLNRTDMCTAVKIEMSGSGGNNCRTNARSKNSFTPFFWNAR